MDGEQPLRHGRASVYIATIVILELLFLLLLFNDSILTKLGLLTSGPLDRVSNQSASTASALILGGGFVAGFFLYSRMGSRVGGVIAIPLAAVETLSNPVVVPYLLLGTVMSFAAGELFFEKLLIYGRRLFYIYLTASVAVMVQLLFGYKLEPLSFSFIIPGIIAYNYHVDRDKKTSLVIAIVYFSVLIVLGLAVIAIQGGALFG